MDDTLKYVVIVLVCCGVLIGVIALEETRIKADAYRCSQGDEGDE